MPSTMASSSISDNLKPMERKKKRKAMDKERRSSAAAENDETNPKQSKTHSQTTMEYAPGGLPEFHISVFKDLSSADGSARHAAAESLVNELVEVQKAYDKLDNKELVDGGMKLEAAEKDDGLNNCAPSVRYAVRRLIRGVSSSRECARQGFALGLALLVGAVDCIIIDSLLKLIVNLLEVSSSTKGQDAKDCLLGRLFAYGAVSRSGRLVEEWNTDKNTPLIKEFVSALISLAAKKRYLQEPSVSIIFDFCGQLPAGVLLDHVLEASGLQDWFDGATDTGNPDALLLALKIREKISVDSSKFGKLLPNPFSPSNLFAPAHLSSLVNCLKESTFCQPRVHSVWPVLVNILLPDVVLQAEDPATVSNSLKKHKKSRKCNPSEEENIKNVQSFCEVIIEGTLILSSHDRKHLAFDILLLLLPRVPASLIPNVLSTKLVQCLMDILSTMDSWLYKVAQHFLKQLLDWVKDDDVRRAAVIVALQKHSNGKFDCITKTKTVKSLMTEFKTEAGCMLIIQSLENLFLDEGYASEEPSDQSQTTDDNSEVVSLEDRDSLAAAGNSDSLKSWVVESVPNILKCLKLDPEPKFRVQKEILKFLAVQGLFSASLGTEITSFELQEKFGWPKAATSSGLCSMCIEQLQLLLAYSQKTEGSHSVTTGLEPNDLGSYFMRFLGTLRNIPSVSLFRTLSDEDEKALKDLQDMEARLSREERKCGLSVDAHKLHGLRYLLIQLLLQVLLQPGEYSEAASELLICCKKAFSLSDLPESSGEDETDDNEEPDLMDVLLDTLLSLLPQSSASVRSAIEKVFKYFCYNLTYNGLVRMLRVIKKDLKPSRHSRDDESESEDESEYEEDEDILDIEEEEDIDEAETGETAESDEQTDDSGAVVPVFVTKETPEDSDYNLDASDDSDEGMDDDAMFRMDTYLARIFQEKKKQAGNETAQSQLIQFKLRVLSLLEIYLHENPGKPEVLKAFSSLVRAFLNTNSEQLSQRVWGILQKQIFKGKDFPKGEGVKFSVLGKLLQKSLRLASKPFNGNKFVDASKKKQSTSFDRHKLTVSLGQNSTFWILKVIDGINSSGTQQKVDGIFEGFLEMYFNQRRCQIKSGFLKEIIRRRPWVGHNLFGMLLKYCESAKLEYRRVEALELLIEILKSLVRPNVDEKRKVELKKIMKSHLEKLATLTNRLVTDMPKKHSRVVEVRKFCSKAFQGIQTVNLTKSFLKQLGSDVRAACESQLGQVFLDLKNSES